MTDEEVRADISNIPKDLKYLRNDVMAFCNALSDCGILTMIDLVSKGKSLRLKCEDIRNCDDYFSKINYRLRVLQNRFDRIKLYHSQRENELLQNKELVELRARIKDLEK